MNKQQMEKIYNRTLVNSVGREKKCSYIKNVGGFINKRLIEVLIVLFVLSSLVGCTKMVAVNQNSDINYIKEENYTVIAEKEYNAYEVAMFQVNRVYSLLKNYNLINYQQDGNRKHYNYTSEDFKQIRELDESYLYGFYLVCDRESLNEVCKALGYVDIKDYLIKNNYVNSNGEPSVNEWFEDNLGNIRKMMSEEDVQRSK